MGRDHAVLLVLLFHDPFTKVPFKFLFSVYQLVILSYFFQYIDLSEQH